MSRIFVTGVLLAALCCSMCAAQNLKQIGLVASPDLNKSTGKMEPNFQQQVWMVVLGQPKRFTLKVMAEEELESADKLKAYSAVVIPSSRASVSAKQLDALKVYVKDGGKLVRDWGAVYTLDEDKASPASKAAVSDFWKEVGGAVVDSNYFNYATTFRFVPGIKRLSLDLPEKFNDGEIPAGNKMARMICYYKLTGAVAVAEAEVMHINSYKWEDEAKPLDGAKAIVCLNKYGKGSCVSTGMAFPRALAGCYGYGKSSISCDIYRTFSANLISWCLE